MIPDTIKDDHFSVFDAEGISVLRQSGIIHTKPEPAFDDIAQLAADACGCPIAAVTFFTEGRQWFKAEISSGFREILLSSSICAHALHQPGTVSISDLGRHPRFKAHPHVTGEPHLRFYAAAPIMTEAGAVLGSVCVFDTMPHPEGLSTRQSKALLALSRAVAGEISLRLSSATRSADPQGMRVAPHPQPCKPVELKSVPDDDCDKAGFQYLYPPGDDRWVSHHAHVPHNDQAQAGHRTGAGFAVDAVNEIHVSRRSDDRRLARVEASTAIVWRADPNGALLKSHGWKEFTGQTPEEFRGSGWLNAVHPEDRARMAATWRKLIESKAIGTTECRVRASSGDDRWVLVTGIPLTDPHGDIQEWIGTISDIHDQRAAEDRLRASEERLRLAVETTGLGIWDFDIVTGRHQWTPEACQLLGLHPDARIDREAVLQVVHPQDRNRVEENFCASGADGALAYSDTFRILRADTGDERWITVTGRTVLSDDGKPVRKIGTAQDITARKLAEIALKRSKDRLSRSEAHLRSILETIPDAMIVTDEKGTIRSFSATAEHIFGYRPDEVTGTNVGRLISMAHGEQQSGFAGPYRSAGEPRPIGNGHVATAHRKDGTTFPMEIQVGEMECDGERYFTAFIRDLTDRQNTEMRMQELQSELAYMSRLTAMGEMGSTLAHEINQPLTAIASYLKGCGLILNTMEGDHVAMLKLAVDEAAEEALRAGEIIRQLREFVARGESEHRVEDLRRLVEEASALGLVGAKEKGVHVAFDFPQENPQVIVNHVQIQQVLINLLRNAVEAMHDVQERLLTIRARVVQDGAMVQVSVKDTGPGIAREVLDKLFTPFTTTKSSGMGVGLSICRTIVESHGGKIWADSCPGDGTAFHFTLRHIDLEEVAFPEAE